MTADNAAADRTVRNPPVHRDCGDAHASHQLPAGGGRSGAGVRNSDLDRSVTGVSADTSVDRTDRQGGSVGVRVLSLPFAPSPALRERVGVRAAFGRCFAVSPLTLALSHKGKGEFLEGLWP